MDKRYNRIKAVMADVGVTSKTLSQKLDVNRTTVSGWITNKNQPGLETLYRIAEALEVDPCDLLVREPISDNDGAKAE